MNNISLSYSPYILKLRSPFITAKGEITEKKGFLITLQDGEGNIGIGDCSPFPFFGSEKFEEAERELERIKLSLNLNLSDIKKSIEETLAYFIYYPALKHGIEQALLKLICKKRNISLNELLNVSSQSPIDVNYAIGFVTPTEAEEKAKQAVKNGFKTIKLKCGRNNFNFDLDVIAVVREAAGKDIALRIDVNGKWDLEEAAKYFKQLESYGLEYIEQPVLSFQEFLELKKLTSIPLAADESIRTFEDALLFINNKAADVLVLKPMMIGGIIPTLKIIEEAEKNNIKVVITSSFESAIGKAIAVFAASVCREKTSHGLAVNDFFEEEFVNDPYPVKNGKIFLS